MHHFLATHCSGIHTRTAGGDCNRLLATEAATIFAANLDLRQLQCHLTTAKRRRCGGRWRTAGPRAGVPAARPCGAGLGGRSSRSARRKGRTPPSVALRAGAGSCAPAIVLVEPLFANQ